MTIKNAAIYEVLLPSFLDQARNDSAWVISSLVEKVRVEERCLGIKFKRIKVVNFKLKQKMVLEIEKSSPVFYEKLENYTLIKKCEKHIRS